MAISIKDLHWAAGFLEGEGSFCATHAGKRPDGRLRGSYNLIVSCGQQNIEPLNKLEKLFGGFISYRRLNYVSKNTPEKKHDLYVWYLTGRRGAALMQTLWSLMSEKRRGQIEIALERWKSNQPPNGDNHKKYVPRGENHPFVKLTDEQVVEIRASKETERILSKKYGVRGSTIGKIKRNERRLSYGH